MSGIIKVVIILWPLRCLFDLCFFENHMLAHNRIVFAKFHLFSGIAGVLLRYVIEPGIGCADQFDQDCVWLCHRYVPVRCIIQLSGGAPYNA